MQGRIRPPRRLPIDDRVTDLSELEAAIRDVVLGKQIMSSHEQLYRSAYKTVLRKQGDRLYNTVESVLYDTLSERLKGLEGQEFGAYAEAHSRQTTFDEEREGVELKLFELKSAWADTQIGGAMIGDILMYMDRVYCDDGNKLPSSALASLAFAKAFANVQCMEKDEMSAPRQVHIQFFSEQFDRHRVGEIVDLSLLEKVATCLKVASEHMKSEESPFHALEIGVLRSTQEFYRSEAEAWSKHASKEIYLSQVPRRVEEEVERCTRVFGEASARAFAEAVEHEFKKQRPHEADPLISYAS